MSLAEQKDIINNMILGLSIFLFLILGFSWINYQANPVDIFVYFGAQAGETVGMSAGVPENPFNKVAQQLKEKEEELQQREELLTERELELREKNFSEEGEMILLMILSVTTTLLFLVLLNFYLDFKNREPLQGTQ